MRSIRGDVAAAHTGDVMQSSTLTCIGEAGVDTDCILNFKLLSRCFLPPRLPRLVLLVLVVSILVSLVTLPLPSSMVSVYMLLPRESSLLLFLKLPIAIGAEAILTDDATTEEGLNAKSVDWLETSATELVL